MSKRAPTKKVTDLRAVSLRLPRELFDQVIKAKAEVERAESRIVPFSQVIVMALAKSFEGDKDKH